MKLSSGAYGTHPLLLIFGIGFLYGDSYEQ